MKVGIIQSNYIPFKGYFDFIDECDIFVLYDDCQYTRRDWRNRNTISTPYGEKWLTIPLWHKGRYDWKIYEMEASGEEWAQSHYDSLKQAYSHFPYWKDYDPEELYARAPQNLAQINRRFIDKICEWLGIKTVLASSVGMEVEGTKTQRLVEICKKMGATTYLSGPAAQAYMDYRIFDEAGIGIEWKQYDYIPYPGMVTHHVSILDMLFKAGADRRYWKCQKAGLSLLSGTMNPS